MLRLYTKDEDCCGCSACASICPVNNIEMQRSEEGFLYPSILSETACLHCDRCLKVCPMKDEMLQNLAEREFFAGIALDEQVWAESASGGAFSSICEICRDKDPVVFGARWDGLDVVMDFCDGVEGIGRFRKSKYVAADPNHSYEKVKQFLCEGRTVIYTGTPCQINGLTHFLGGGGGEHANLLLIDFACHGQGSPLVFEKWIKWLEARYGQKITGFQFREKRVIGDHVNSNCCSFILEDGRKIVEARDYYHHAYVKGLHMRRSCIECKYAAKHKADITLADFKNLYVGLPEFKELKNVSTMVANTPKGKDIIAHLSNMRLYRPDPEFVVRFNPKLEKSLAGNKERDLFMRSMRTAEIDILRLIKSFSRILPSEWVEYHCAERTLRRFSRPLHILDRAAHLRHKMSIYFLKKQLRHQNSKNTPG